MILGKQSQNIRYVIVILFGIVIFLFYASNIKNICTVWQIGDEPGYLMNTAFFTGHDWSGIYDVIPYYGYGYSLILIPCFLFFHTGVEIIRCAIFINILCIVLTYFIQIAVMKIITDDKRVSLLAFISFITCFYPYMIGEAFQVIAESLLVTLFWMSIFLLCKALEKQKMYLYILYGFCITYMFFVHTRTIAVLAASLMTVLICVLQKKIKLRYAVAFGCTCVFFLLIGFGVKRYLIDAVYIGVTNEGELKDRNIITATFILDRLKWLFDIKNMQLYIYGFFAKLFYALVSTMTMAAIGILYIYKELLHKEKQFSLAKSGSMLFTLLSFMMMFAACCVSGTGASDNFTYFFYGRYFEYAMMPFVFMGIYKCVSSDMDVKTISAILILCLFAGIASARIIKYLDSSEIHIDVYRIAGFAGGIKRNSDFVGLILYFTLVLAAMLFIIYWINKMQKMKGLLMLVVLLFFYDSSSICIDTINQINQHGLSDTKIAEYVIKNHDNNSVYFIDDGYKYYGFYSRMQVLMPEIPMQVVQIAQVDQLEDNSYCITYKGCPSDITLGETWQSVAEGSVFNLYMK